MNDELNKLEFYAVRNREGQWFHRKGYSGTGDSWVEDVLQARIYNKIGHARRQVTFFAKNWPSFGVPEIVVFKVAEHHVIDETERFKKQREKEEKKAGIQRINTAKKRMEKAQREYEEAQRSAYNYSRGEE